ncbi:MAG: hypothetical protein ACRC6I_08190 [Paracoccaceae bacterium]
MSYVPVGQARFSIAPNLEGEALTIPAVQNIFIMLFLPIWLALWTVGGFAAIGSLVMDFHLFILFWLMGWALGWIAVFLTLAWMFAGKQTLRMIGQDLEVTVNIFGFQRRSLYAGRDIRQISVASADMWPLRRWPQMPFGLTGATGAVQFTYGARAYYLAPGMDPAEAGQIADWLKKRLPGNE